MVISSYYLLNSGYTNAQPDILVESDDEDESAMEYQKMLHDYENILDKQARKDEKKRLED